MGLIWEISGHASVGFAWNFGARLFWKHTNISIFNNISNIKVFQDTVSEKCSCPKDWARARARPHGPGPWAGPILGHGQAQYGPGQAHIWAWAGPNMGLEYIGMTFWTLENIKTFFFNIFSVYGNMSKRKIQIFAWYQMNKIHPGP